VKLGKLEAAKERFEKALQIDSEFAKAYGGLGRVYYEQGKLDKAASKFKRATELEVRNPKSYYYLGEIYQRQGKKEKALKKYKYAALMGNKEALEKIKELNAEE